jgi:RNA polymerase sigma-70 factor (ECF subfamily)
MISSIPNTKIKQTCTNPPEVTQWIQLTIEGDDESAKYLMEFLYPQVMSIVRARLPRRGCVEDLAQDIFIRIFRKLEQYSGKVPLKHWVSRIAVNMCTNAYHKAKANQELRLADLGEEEALVIESLATSDEELEPSQSWAARELVDKLLETLNVKDRLLVDLICLRGYTYNQAREETGWNISAMKVRLFRIRKRLEKTLHRLTSEQAGPVIEFPGGGLNVISETAIAGVGA